jgi:hypothetical protein
MAANRIVGLDPLSGALEHLPEVPRAVSECPPDWLIRSAVLQPGEAIHRHLAGCPRCMSVYCCALGAERPRPDLRH